MNQISLENLGVETIMDILSRLPLPSVVYCMCVSKAWYKVVCTPDFVKYHLSKSKRVPALLAFDHLQSEHLMSYKLFDFVDHGFHLQRHEDHYNLVTESRLPYRGKIHGSVNGLLLSADVNLKPDGLSIFNPVTREYVTIESRQNFVCSDRDVVVYGFGVANLSGTYKVLRISQVCRIVGSVTIELVPEKWVYTVGTGEWKKIKTWMGLFYLYREPDAFTRNSAQFHNGILHWVASDAERKLRIACFDLEKERFYSFPPPPTRQSSTTGSMAALSTLGDSLLFCDSLPTAEIAIWSRRDDKTWNKILAFDKTRPFFTCLNFGLIFPLKVFIDGDVLFEWDHPTRKPFYCKNRSYSFLTWDRAILHTPSFLSLKTFDKENVGTFE